MKRHVAAITVLMLAAIPASQAFGAGERELELVMTRNPNLKAGEELYQTCAACHGPNGEGVADGTVPALAGQPFSVLARQIVNFRSGGRSDERMAHFTDSRHLAFSQPIADVAGYISKLKRPAGKPIPARPEATRGAMIYVRTCERCHGPVAEGDEVKVMPRLAAQHYEYLLKQLNDAAAGRRPDLAEAHAGAPQQIGLEQRTAVAAWLASMPVPEE